MDVDELFWSFDIYFDLIQIWKILGWNYKTTDNVNPCEVSKFVYLAF